MAVVTGTFATTGQSSALTGAGSGGKLTIAFSGIPNRALNLIRLEVSFDTGTNWVETTYSWNENTYITLDDASTSIQYRLNCLEHDAGTTIRYGLAN